MDLDKIPKAEEHQKLPRQESAEKYFNLKKTSLQRALKPLKQDQ